MRNYSNTKSFIRGFFEFCYYFEQVMKNVRGFSSPLDCALENELCVAKSRLAILTDATRDTCNDLNAANYHT